MDQRLKRLRDRAVEGTLERIRRDREASRERLQPLLDTIARRFLDLDFDVNALWRETGTSHNASAWFSELQTTPAKYIADRRVETAGRLLRLALTASVWDVAYAVGFNSVTAFNGRFKEYFNLTPTEYRGASPRDVGEDAGGDARAAQADVQGFFSELELLYSKACPFGLVSGEELERMQVEYLIWPRLARRELTFEEEKQLVARCHRLSTPVLYEHLHAKAREEGRKDRRRRIELAQLALAAAEALADRHPGLRPQARAWLGNARQHDFDFLGADRDISQAVTEAQELTEPAAFGIVYWLKGTLRMSQRRHAEAIECFEASYFAFKQRGDGKWAIEVLLYRVAALTYAERYDEALRVLGQAESLMEPEFGRSLAFRVDYSTALLLERMGDFAQAERFIESLRVRSQSEQRLYRCLVQWLDACITCGLGRAGAESRFLAALKELESLSEPLYEGLLLLDIAIFYAQVGRVAKVVEITAKICPFFAALQLCEETTASLKLLSNSTLRTQVDAELLLRFRACLRRDPLAEMGQILDTAD